MLYFLLSMPTAAMGLQTVTVTRVFGLRVYTTYLTGSLAKFAEAVVHQAFWFYDRTRGHSRKRFWIAVRISAHQKYARHAVLTGGLWIAFFLGVICGALLRQRYDLFSLCFQPLSCWSPRLWISSVPWRRLMNREHGMTCSSRYRK
jgi:uncharacterized membrane protein YoaK (UPF0700 family)